MFSELKSKYPEEQPVLRIAQFDQAGILKRFAPVVVHDQRLFAGKRWQENALIFPWTIGTPMGPRNRMRHFKSTLNAAGLPDIRVHDLRHTAATLMLQQGIHPKVVQE